MPQFREVQGAESPEFLQLFDNGVQCVPQPPQYLRARAVARPTLTVCAA